jgi:hypothetical protein
MIQACPSQSTDESEPKGQPSSSSRVATRNAEGRNGSRFPPSDPSRPLIEPENPVREFRFQRAGVSQPRRCPNTTTSDGDTPESLGADAWRVPRRAGVVPRRLVTCQTEPGCNRREACPPAMSTSVSLPLLATVPPDRRTEFWKMVGTGERKLPRGATSFCPSCSPSVRQAPPGTCSPVRETWKWRKLVITEPIAIRLSGFPKNP